MLWGRGWLKAAEFGYVPESLSENFPKVGMVS